MLDEYFATHNHKLVVSRLYIIFENYEEYEILFRIIS